MIEPRVSIIIRARNEERWIVPCLNAIFEQTTQDFEVILVDSGSTDETVKKARGFKVNLISYQGEYFPGKAMNRGVLAAMGNILVFLSAHCIPTNDRWLESLIAGFKDKKIAGIYGRQQPMTFSSPQDKRDLTIAFGLDRRIQKKDPFFHNANSAIRREVWEKYPFNESVSNIEDRFWAEKVLNNRYYLLYEPEASVYHYHGIHHGNKVERLKTTVRILGDIHANNNLYEPGSLDPAKLSIAAFIPVKGLSPKINGKRILQYTLDSSRESKLIKETLILTDNQKMAAYAEQQGVKVPFLRPEKYSKDEVDLNSVYAFCLKRLESEGWFPDLIVCLEPTFPFRPMGLIDDMIREFFAGGYDSLLPVRAEYNYCWLAEEQGYRRVDGGDNPRHLRSPVFTGLKGIGCVVYPEVLRKGRLIGENVGLIQIKDPFAVVEVRSLEDYKLFKLAQEGLAKKNSR